MEHFVNLHNGITVTAGYRWWLGLWCYLMQNAHLLVQLAGCS